MSEDVFAKEVAANRANWDSRAVVHAGSDAYHIKRYVEEPDLISDVVQWDRRILGDVTGLDLAHLQCHIGTDTLSWARLGANVVGLDLSPESLRVARKLASDAGAQIEYVQADVRDADRALGRQFDLVYTSVGVLCWVPEIRRWARAAAACVRPGGRLYVRDGHPILATFDYDRKEPPLVCKGDYFGEGKPFREDFPYTYTGDTTPLSSPVNYEWRHSLGEIVTALLDAGLRIERFEEYDWLDWKALPWMVQDADGRWRFPPGQARLPLQFAILATRP